MHQVDGMFAGYELAAPTAQHMAFDDMWTLNIGAELTDLFAAFNVSGSYSSIRAYHSLLPCCSVTLSPCRPSLFLCMCVCVCVCVLLQLRFHLCMRRSATAVPPSSKSCLTSRTSMLPTQRGLLCSPCCACTSALHCRSPRTSTRHTSQQLLPVPWSLCFDACACALMLVLVL